MEIRDTFFFKYVRETIRRFQCRINPEKEVDRCYYSAFHKHWDSKDPKDLIEKIFWLELYADTTLWSKCADKYRVREYIEELGLLNYMPKLYGHWYSIKDIDYETLPNSFVIKSNNGCATVKVVKDKSSLDIRKLNKELWQWLHLPFGAENAQMHYWPIKPCIIAEELLSNDFTQISPNSLVDFKLWCINGTPQFFLITYNRVNMHVYVQCYDTEWKPKPEYLINNISHIVYNQNDELLPKPACLDEMLSLAKRISAPFPEVRVDFYVVNNKPVIGELTFTTAYGYFNREIYESMGEMIDLSKIERIK